MATKFLTKEGFQKLQEELDHLKTVKRQEVADRLHEAMEGGELIENAEYEAAKNEQAFVEGRIQELDMLLATARVIEPETSRPARRHRGALVRRSPSRSRASRRRRTRSSAPPRPIRARARSRTSRPSARPS